MTMKSDAPNLDLYPVAEDSAVLEQIPVIDVADLVRDAASPAAADAVDRIADACRTWGFFQVVNHGVDQARITEVWRQVHAFFALPIEEKIAEEGIDLWRRWTPIPPGRLVAWKLLRSD